MDRNERMERIHAKNRDRECFQTDAACQMRSKFERTKGSDRGTKRLNIMGKLQGAIAAAVHPQLQIKYHISARLIVQ